MSVTERGSSAATALPAPPVRRRRRGIHGNEGAAGWAFVAPVVVILGLFLVIPILMAAWVSLTGWRGKGSPITGHPPFVGLGNYKALLTQDGLARSDFMTSIRNNIYYVALVVPLQTILALGLALVLNRQRLKGKGFFRTAYYFPSVTSSVAVSIVFLFLFSSSGAVNAALNLIGINGPQWFADPRGVLQLLLDKLHIVNIDSPPAALADHGFLGLAWWDWISGPSVAMCAIIALVVWTTAGTFMLVFLAALQDIPMEVEESASLDGTSRWQRLRFVVLPMLKPSLFLVLTLGLIGTWQVFDQIYLMSQGAPGKTTLTPAYLSYRASFNDLHWGQGAAMSFILFAIIVVLTFIQRQVMKERDTVPRRRRMLKPEETRS